jgi:hypothetical protein
MNDPEFDRNIARALREAVPQDEGFWARQRAQVLSRLPDRRPRAWRRWAWTPLAAAGLAALLLWPRRAPAPPVPAGLLQDMDVVQNLDLAQDLDLMEDLDRMGEPL